MHRSILFHLLFAASSAVLVRGMEQPKGAAPLQQFKIGEVVEVHHNDGAVSNSVFKGIQSSKKGTRRSIVESFGPCEDTTTRSLEIIKKKKSFQHPDASLGIQIVSCTVSKTIEEKDAEQTLPPNRHTGAVVSEALRGGRAFKEGIRKTQRVLKVGDKEVIHMLFDEIKELIRNDPLAPLEFEVPLEVTFHKPIFRDGKGIKFGPAHGKIGAVVTAVDGNAKRRGVCVGQHVLALKSRSVSSSILNCPATWSTCGTYEYDTVMWKITSDTFIPNIKDYYLEREEAQRIHRMKKGITVESFGYNSHRLNSDAFRREYPTRSRDYDGTEHLPASILFGKRVTVKPYKENEIQKYFEDQKRIPNKVTVTIVQKKAERKKSTHRRRSSSKRGKNELVWSLEWVYDELKVDGIPDSGSHSQVISCPENTIITFACPREQYYIIDAETDRPAPVYRYEGRKLQTFQLWKKGETKCSCLGLHKVKDSLAHTFTIVPSVD